MRNIYKLVIDDRETDVLTRRGKHSPLAITAAMRTAISTAFVLTNIILTNFQHSVYTLAVVFSLSLFVFFLCLSFYLSTYHSPLPFPLTSRPMVWSLSLVAKNVA